jgi:hypothetical protein
MVGTDEIGRTLHGGFCSVVEKNAPLSLTRQLEGEFTGQGFPTSEY